MFSGVATIAAVFASNCSDGTVSEVSSLLEKMARPVNPHLWNPVTSASRTIFSNVSLHSITNSSRNVGLMTETNDMQMSSSLSWSRLLFVETKDNSMLIGASVMDMLGDCDNEIKEGLGEGLKLGFPEGNALDPKGS